MKRIILMLIAIYGLFAGCGKKESSKPESEKILTEVVGTFTPLSFGKESTSDNFIWSKTTFNSEGKIITLSKRIGINVFDKSKGYEETTYIKYDNGKMSEKKDDTYRYTYIYNGSDTSEVRQYGSSGLYLTVKYEYNNNRVTSQKTYFADGSLFSINNIMFNSDGTIKNKEILYNPFKSINQLQYTYDSKGNVLLITYFNREKNTTSTEREYKYIYDSQGRVTEYTYSWGILSFRRWVRFYDTENRVERENVFESGSMNGVYEQKGIINYKYNYK